MRWSNLVVPMLVASVLGVGCATLPMEAPSSEETETQEATSTSEPTPIETEPATPTAEPTASPTATVTPRPTAGPGLDTLLATPNAFVASADLENAAVAYQDLIRLYPNDAEPWLGLASIAQREGFPDLALEHLYSAVEADPIDLEALRQLAIFLEQQSSYEEVLSIYSQMIEIQPDDADLYVARGGRRGATGGG